MFGFLAPLMIISSVFTVWFSFGDWLRLPVVVVIFSAFFCVIYMANRSFMRCVYFEDLLMFLFLVLAVFSSVISVGSFVSKDWNNLLALIFIVFFLYFVQLRVILGYLSSYGISHLLLFFRYSYILLSFIFLSDFILANLFGYMLSDIVEWGFSGNASYFEKSGFLIPAGPTEEPPYVAGFLNFLFPFFLWSFTLEGKGYTPFLWIFHLGLIFITTSSAAIVFFFLAAFFAAFGRNDDFYISDNSKRVFKYFAYAAFLISTVLFLYEDILSYAESVALFDKLLLSEDSLSASIRTYSWVVFWNSWIDSVWFGYTPAYSKIIVDSGVHSTFFTFLLNYGLIPTFFFFLMIFIVFYKALRLGFYAKMALYLIVMHSAINDFYFQPVFWIVLGSIISIYNYGKKYNTPCSA